MVNTFDLGQGLYYISLKKYFKPKDMIKNYRLDLGLVIFFLTIFSVSFSYHHNKNDQQFASIATIFLYFSLRLLNQNRSEDIRRGSNLFIISNWINIVFWILIGFGCIFCFAKISRLYEMIIVMSYLSSLMLCVLGSLGLIFLINQRLTMLEKEKLKFMTIIETSPDSVVVTNLSDGKIVIANNNFMKKCSILWKSF